MDDKKFLLTRVVEVAVSREHCPAFESLRLPRDNIVPSADLVESHAWRKIGEIVEDHSRQRTRIERWRKGT